MVAQLDLLRDTRSVTAAEPDPADRTASIPLRVYFEDTDAGGMAYHATLSALGGAGADRILARHATCRTSL